MEYIRLGQSGLKVSRLCLGTMNMGTPQWKPWIFDEAQSEPIVRHALEAGVNFILDAVFENNYRACKNAIVAAMKGLPHRDEVFAAAREVSNPFYTPKQR